MSEPKVLELLVGVGVGLRASAGMLSGWLVAAGASAGVRAQVAAHLPRDTALGHAELPELLDARLGHQGTGQRSRIFDAAAIPGYHAQTALPVVEVLVCDAAGQFVGVTLGPALRVPSG